MADNEQNKSETFHPHVEPSAESLESARKWREFFVSLTRVGFSEQQAMQIIMASQMNRN